MRLTLRTLLAFLNDAGLKTRDRKEIRSRIKKSENARKLMQHLKVITSDPGVEIIEPNDHSDFKNPNRVAQYLDAAMSEKEVEPFEKEALASAPLLSEIANCHSILAILFRSEPVSVPLGIRQKIYSLSPVRGDLESMDDGEFADEHQVHVPTIKPDLPLPRSGEAGSNGISQSAGNSRGITKVVTAASPQSESFECSEPGKSAESGAFATGRNPFKRRGPWIALAALMLLLSGIGLGWVIGNGGWGLRNNDRGPLADADRSEVEGTANKESSDTGKQGDRTNPADSSQGDSKKAEAQDEPDKSLANKNSPDGKSESGKTGPPKVDPKDAAANSKKPVDDQPGKRVPKTEPKGDAKSDAKSDGKDDAKADGNQGEVGDPPGDGIKEPEPPVAATFAKPEQLAVRWSPKSGRWSAIDEESAIRGSETIKTFHGFPVSLDAVGLGSVSILGRSRFQFQFREPKTNCLQIEYGKFEIVGDENEFEVEAAGRKIHIKTTRPDSQIWIHVRRFSPNRDLANWKDRTTLFQLYVAKGKAVVTEGKSTVELSIAGGFEWVDQAPARSGALQNRRPGWTTAASEWYIDSSAAGIIEKIKRDEPIEQQLTEMTDDIRFEVVTNATQMLCTLGYYQPLIQLLDNENNRVAWSRTIERFREDLAVNRDLIQKLNESLGEAKDPEQQALFAMLVGTNNKQLEAGMDQVLVKQLESKSLARRVLAIENLNQVTSRTYLFRPDVLERFRKPKVRQWARDMEKKRIRFAKPFELPRFEFSVVHPAKAEKPTPPDPEKKNPPGQGSGPKGGSP